MKLALNPSFQTNDQLVYFDKPAGISTHSPDHGKVGLCEILERELGQHLFVVHRLDKTTTGAIVFARTAAAAKEVSELFKNHQVTKKYLFVTDRVSDRNHFEITSEITKADREKKMLSRECSVAEGANSRTEFVRVKRSPFFELWEARPQSGKPHQIRVHTANAGLPILGDTLYGGTEFPHLCLHSWELDIPGFGKWISQEPLFMKRLGSLRDIELIRAWSEIDRRERLYGILQQPENCIRLMHTEDLRVDAYGKQLWVYWYRDSEPTAKDISRWEYIAFVLKKEFLLRKMQNRGDNPHERKIWHSEGWQSSWTAKENEVKFEFQDQLGQSPGLFLDQRENRGRLKDWLASRPGKSKCMLNLFSYTCGFSVVAGSEKAKTTSVDLSQPFLDWGKRNFQLNEISLSDQEFQTQESMLFLKGAVKRGRQFDVIICDPPSFGRFKDGKKTKVFQLDKEFPELVDLCWKALAPGGLLLLSCNFEKWDAEQMKSRILKVIPRSKIDSISAGSQGFDFELPNQPTLMKSFWLSKRG